MTPDPVTGSCLCGSIRYQLTPPYAAFRYCHCTRCQKASGSAHAANLFAPAPQFRWLEGESLLKRYDLPTAQRFSVWFCTNCGTRMPHKVRNAESMLIPAGTLDTDPVMKPELSIFWQSRSAWYVEPGERPRFDDYPK